MAVLPRGAGFPPSVPIGGRHPGDFFQGGLQVRGGVAKDIAGAFGQDDGGTGLTPVRQGERSILAHVSVLPGEDEVRPVSPREETVASDAG